MADGNELSWKDGQVLAWTERDGPGRPPAGPNRTLSLSLAGALGVVFAGMLATDALCPEHRAWVQGLATIALIGTVAAAVGLARGWSAAPLLTLGVASIGVAIGALDAVHSATRGRVLIVAFGLVFLAAGALSLKRPRLAAWDRSMRESLRTPDDGANDALPNDELANDELANDELANDGLDAQPSLADRAPARPGPR